MATRTQRPSDLSTATTSPRALSLSNSPRIGSSSLYVPGSQFRSRPRTRDGPSTSSARSSPLTYSPQRDGHCILRSSIAPSTGSATAKGCSSRSPRCQVAAGLGLNGGELFEQDGLYFCPRSSGDRRLRGVSAINSENPNASELVRNAHRMNSGGFSSSISSNVVSGSRSGTMDLLPTSNSMPLLTTALQRLKDSDLETFKLERACGMTPDPVRFARLVGPFGTDEEVANALSEMGGSRGRNVSRGEEMEGVELPSRISQCTPTQYAPPLKTCNMPKDLSGPASNPLDETYTFPCVDPSAKVARHNTLPSSTSAPAGLQKFRGRNAIARSSLRPRTEVPPFVPTQNPHFHLKRLEHIIATFRGKPGYEPYGRPQDGVGGRYDLIKSLIGVDQLLLEHDLDTRMEHMRTQMERREDGMGYLERSVTTKGKEKAIDPVWRKPLCMVDRNDGQLRVFGQPLHLTKMYSFCVAGMGGYQHDLPIVVYACVEELYRTGMTVPGLFRTPPDRGRHNQLIDAFDRGPGFGKSISLAKESTADICALLVSFLERLPRPIWHESLYDALLEMCIKPSLRKEREEVEQVEREERTHGGHNETDEQRRHSMMPVPNAANSFDRVSRDNNGAAGYQRTRSSSLGSSSAAVLGNLGHTLDAAAVMNIHSRHNAAVLTAAQRTIAAEYTEIEAARTLFRLLPRAQLSLFSYLLAFFSQIPLSPQNLMSYDDVARIFSAPIFLGKQPLRGGSSGVSSSKSAGYSMEAWQEKKKEARNLLLWILRRWAYISPGLFEVDETNALGNNDDVVMDNEKVDFRYSGSEESGSANSNSQTGGSEYAPNEGARFDVNDGSAFGVSSPLKALKQSSHSSTQPMPSRRGADDMATNAMAKDFVWNVALDSDVQQLRRELEFVKWKLEQVVQATSSQDVLMHEL